MLPTVPDCGNSPLRHTSMRWVPCWYGKAAVNRRDAGSIPATAASRKRKGKPTGDGSLSRNRPSSDKRLDGFDSLKLPLKLSNVPLTERQRFQSSNLARRVRLPQGTLEVGSVAQRQSRGECSTARRLRSIAFRAVLAGFESRPSLSTLRGSFCW